MENLAKVKLKVHHNNAGFCMRVDISAHELDAETHSE